MCGKLSQAVGKYVRVNCVIPWGLLALPPQDSVLLSARKCPVLAEVPLTVADILVVQSGGTGPIGD